MPLVALVQGQENPWTMADGLAPGDAGDGLGGR